ncbi:type VI secretion system protein TssR [Myroides odoratus]|nr:type VI secretion system protein TssR domain-containing protein [Myroides odoratus]WQD57828.1 type VI secretion system protein TssR [Myroides odoratus]
MSPKKIMILCLLGMISLSGCSVKQRSLKQTPAVSVVGTYDEYSLLSGYPKHAKPWIVYVAKQNASLYANATSESTDKKVAFFTPLIVLKQKGDRYEVAEYDATSIVEGKIDVTKLKGQGWIHRHDLLLWTASLRDATTGFRLKGMLALQEKAAVTRLEKYMDNDSLYVFKDPSLLHREDRKLSLNTLVYLYAFTADKKKVFIGESPTIVEGNPDNKMYGWVDTDVLGIWGTRTAFRIKPSANEQEIQLTLERKDQSTIRFTPIESRDSLQGNLRIEQLYPLTYRPSVDEFQIKYLDQLLDYSENKVYNVEGQPIYYDAYRKILAGNRKLNVVFVLDGAIEAASLTPLKGVFQGLGTQLSSSSYFTSISYATLFYHIDPRSMKNNTSQLLDFNHWSNSLTTVFNTSPPSTIPTTLYTAMEDLTRLLKSKENQSNVVVIVGQRFTIEDQAKQKELVRQIASTGSRVIFYQVRGNPNDAHNDFVLAGEEITKISAAQIARDKKQRLVDYKGIVDNNVFDLSQEDQGVYQLDYPMQSMHQGAVIFPRKGEDNKPLLLQQVFSKMVQDITMDNQHIDSTLTAVFRSDVGVAYTKAKPDYVSFNQQTKNKVSIPIAKQLIHRDYAFMREGILQNAVVIAEENKEYGVLLDEEEIEQVQQYYRSVYEHVFKKGGLNNKKMIRRYITTARKNSLTPKKMNRKFWRTNPVAIGLFHQTGLYLATVDTLAQQNLKQWKHADFVNAHMLKHFFKSFQTLADQLKEYKENQTEIAQQNGTNFYWFNQTYIPVLDYSKIKEVDHSFDILPIELEQIQASSSQKKKNKTSTKKYLTRVKKGILNK